MQGTLGPPTALGTFTPSTTTTKMRSLPIVLSLPALGHALSFPRADCANVTCVPAKGAAHIIVSRASTEAPGPGILGQVADSVVASCAGSDIASNPYPALLSPYQPSEPEGVGNLTELVTSYQACCPDSKIVL